LKELAARHGRATLMAVVIFLLIVVPIFLVRYYRASAREKASELFSAAKQPGDLENLVKDYPETPTAPLAMLSFARSLYDKQDYTRAQTTYESFLAKHPKHQFAAIAEMGKAHCLEGKGLTQEALKSFESFLAANKEHYLRTQAVLGKARCLHQLGRTGEARVAIEDFVSANPKSPWKPRAEEMIEEFKRPPVTAAPRVESLIPPGTNMPVPSLIPPAAGN
jgi:outer membrane protein assembly factor BamD (BamD/ComL family)